MLAPHRSDGRPRLLQREGRREPAHAHALGHAPHAWTARRRRRSGRGSRTCSTDLGVRVLEVPPDPKQPGLVYPANAGFLTDVDAEKPRRREDLPPREPAADARRREAALPARARGGRLPLRRPRPALPHGGRGGLLPRRRALPAHARTHRAPALRARAGAGRPGGASTASAPTPRVEPLLREIVKPRDVLRIELVREAHYHGDTALCAFGPGRRHLLAWRPALAPGGWERLEAAFPGALIPLSDEDAACYAANSFTLTQDGVCHLVMPEGVSAAAPGAGSRARRDSSRGRRVGVPRRRAAAA